MKTTLVARVAGASAFACLIPTLLSAGPLLSTDKDPSAQLAVAARFQNFGSGGGKEVYVGLPPVTDPNRVEADVVWSTTKCVELSYDGSSVRVKVANAIAPCSFSSPLVTVTKSSPGLTLLNYLEIKITKNGATDGVALQNIRLGGTALGSVSVTGGANTQYWKITGADLGAGFALSGTVVLTGLSGSGESSHIELAAGYFEPPDNLGPITSNVVVTPVPVIVNGPATISANVDDSTTGGNTIVSAEYTLNGGSTSTMNAQDGTFDDVSEDVSVTVPSMTEVGHFTACVFGTDSANNTGAAACDGFFVTYAFTGFFSPIDSEFLNSAKAGQAIPAKWRLTDANGIGIADPASFAGLHSYPINCATMGGEISDSVEEYAAGESGLQNLGDGYWQFNWKTPKTYAETCRAMYVRFDSGTISPVVAFKFKK